MAESGLITVLFTDLVGSTALSERIGDGAADHLRRRHFELLRSVVARTGGEEVKTAGDAIMVTYKGAADAIAGAVGMQQVVERDNRQSAEPLSMRVGISVGDATFDDDDWYGRPVTEAHRLCAAAHGGQILVASIVRTLAGSRAEHELVPVGPLDLKGFSEPVEAVEVRWEPAQIDPVPAAVPLPGALAREDAFSFVGRDQEIELVLRAWKEAAAGGRRVVLLAGEPGIGKTRLTSEVARVAHDQGAVVLWGECEEELGVPYQPVAEALTHLAHSLPTDQLSALLGPWGPELTRLVSDLPRLVPDLGESVPGDPDTERFRLFEAVVDVLVNASAQRPLLVVLDDLHWAAKPTLLLLLHVVRSTRPIRVLIVATYRDTDLDRRDPLAEALADFRRTPDVERVSLTGLDITEVTAFMEAAAGHELDERALLLAEALHDETEGNPFFIGEVLLHLVESGALVQRDGRWASDLTLAEVGLPAGVREVIGRRLSRLSEGANEVLSLAAVIGRDFELSLLVSVHSGGEDEVLEALERAERAGLVRPTGDRVGRYTFSHALVRSALYEDLSTSRRLRLHREVGRGLERQGDSADGSAELAHHFAACAALGEVDRAIDYSQRAARRAIGDLAYEEAALHYERALGVLRQSDRRDPVVECDLLLGQGNAYSRGRDPRDRPTLLEAALLARGLGDARRLAVSAIELTSNRWWPGPMTLNTIGRRGPDADITTVADLLDEALTLLPDVDSHTRARALAARAVNETHAGGDQDRRRALSEAALAMARRLGDTDLLRKILLEQWTSWQDTSRPNWLDEAMAVQNELIELASGQDDEDHFFGLWMRSSCLLTAGQRAEAERDLAEAIELAQRLRDPLKTWWTMSRTAGLLILRGQLEAAEPAILEAATYGTAHGFDGAGDAAPQLFRLRFDQGRLREYEDAVVDLVEANPEQIVWRTALAAIYLQTDRPHLARPHVEFVGADGFRRVPTGGSWLITVAGTGSVAAATGQLDIVGWAYDLSVGFAGQLCQTAQSFERPVDLFLANMAAALGRVDDAEHHSAASLDLCERAEAPTFAAYTKEAWAQILIARGGDPHVARRWATEALTTARELGMARLEETSQRTLDLLG